MAFLRSSLLVITLVASWGVLSLQACMREPPSSSHVTRP